MDLFIIDYNVSKFAGAGFLAQIFILRTDFPETIKLSAEKEIQAVANELVPEVFLFIMLWLASGNQIYFSCK